MGLQGNPTILAEIINFVGPRHAVQLFGIKLVGVDAINGKKLVFALIFIASMWLLGYAINVIARVVIPRRYERARFWTRQGIRLSMALIALIGLLSIWFDDPTRLATAVGLVTAGLAFALQKVVTALAGYFVILRGQTFNVGDRITMGGVRGDVIALGFLQTTIMEMGQPPPVQEGDPPMWVRARQYTGRIVTVTNAKIFDEPVYNYTRDFPYIWDEMVIPITYDADRAEAERVMVEAAEAHTVKSTDMGQEAIDEMKRRYFIHQPGELKPRCFYRITDNWLELTVRFIVGEHGIRTVKDAMSRDILKGLDAAGIGIASATYDIVGLPPIRMKAQPSESVASNGADRA